MSAEISGFDITVSCSQDPAITFHCRAKQRPGIRLGNKIEVTTDQSLFREFEPGNRTEFSDGILTVLDDPALENRIRAVLGKKGTITFHGRTTNTDMVYQNAWFASYVPANADRNERPTAGIIIQLSGKER